MKLNWDNSFLEDLMTWRGCFTEYDDDDFRIDFGKKYNAKDYPLSFPNLMGERLMAQHGTIPYLDFDWFYKDTRVLTLFSNSALITEDVLNEYIDKLGVKHTPFVKLEKYRLMSTYETYGRHVYQCVIAND